ncbi:MAG: hypothetical protein RML95_11645, partial [Anaerolineae bacterium]|nr:hypothetical protein [Anaerolineae bacterium]
LPSDLESYFVRRLQQELQISLDPEQDSVLQALHKALHARTEALYTECHDLKTYLDQSERIIGYIRDAENHAEQQLHKARHHQKAAIQETIQQFRKWRSVLEGTHLPQQAR